MTTDLQEIEEIKKLKARYFRLMDTKQWDDWGLVFAEEALMEVPEADMVVNGRAEIVETVSGALEGVRTAHHGHMPEIELTGEGKAAGIWAMFDHVEWPQKGDSRTGITGYGHYHETYVKRDGRWQISSLRLERLRVDPLS